MGARSRIDRHFSPRAFSDAFADAPRPGRDDITSHPCEECEKVSDDLAGYSAADVPDEVAEYHADSMALLTPTAFRYYLPRYVRLSCDNPEAAATDFVLFNLCPDGGDHSFLLARCEAFTQRECEAIVSYLEHRKTWPDAEIDAEWMDPALEFWSQLARARS